MAGNTSTLLVLPAGLKVAASTLSWDLSQLPAGSVGVVTGGVGTITVAGPPAVLLDRWLIAGPATAGQSAQGPVFNYNRGMLYFANLDATLHARSAGKTGLLAALRPLFDARAANRPITLAIWEDFLRQKLGETQVGAFRREIIRGELIEPLPGAFGPHLERVSAQSTLVGKVRRGYAWRSRQETRASR